MLCFVYLIRVINVIRHQCTHDSSQFESVYEAQSVYKVYLVPLPRSFSRYNGGMCVRMDKCNSWTRICYR